MKKLIAAACCLYVFVLFSFAKELKKQNRAFNVLQENWVDSVFKTLSPQKRLAQLFMVAAYSNKDMKHVREIKDLVEKQGIGGLIWMQGSPTQQGKLANYYQSVCKVPLLYSIDGEWGLAMRLDSTIRYPRQMTLGAITNDSLIYQMGRQIAGECKRIGIHINFAPVADVNNNPLNPVIGLRSFGENKYKVAQKAYMYMKGLQDEGIMTSGKHFPGHGDTDTDSHTALPIIPHNRQRLDSLELYPFRYLFDRGLQSVMVAHLNIPSMDTSTNMISTLSPAVVNGLLKKEMNFKGLVFTDALNMKGVSATNTPGEADAKALLAGNDVLLFSGDVPKAIIEIEKNIALGKITQEEIDERCKKVLRAKYWCGLYKKQEIVTRNLTTELNTKQGAELNDKLAEAAVTLLKNENNFLPLKRADTTRIIAISFGVEEPNTLFQTVREHGYTEHIGLSHDAAPEQINYAFERINTANVVILQVSKTTRKPDDNFGIKTQTLRLIDSIAGIKPSVLVMYSTPYLLNCIGSLSKYRAVIMAYEYMPSLLHVSANIILGINRPLGKLPVSTTHFKSETGLTFGFVPQHVIDLAKENFMSKKFGAVDSLALAGITEKAYPGCQIVAISKGRIVYQKSFGNYTYNNASKKVTNHTFYDLASVTKIAVSSLALMKLTSDSLFNYKKTLGAYLPELAGTNKENLIIEEILAHQAGLQSWIPFYEKTLEKNGKFKPEYYSNKPSAEFPACVASDLYAVKGINDTIYSELVRSKTEKQGTYLYSDLGYYFMQKIIEQQSGERLDTYVRNMYAKLGLGLMYRPLNYISKTQVAPTEYDSRFRKQFLQGYVHDPGAALMGGVAGHAGLFGNAHDVAKLMQFFMNGGELDGKRLLDSNVVRDFTLCHFCPANRRALCFEKPETNPNKESPVTQECSPQSFGHMGFTGSFAWADPVNKLVVVFLSNRVYPYPDDNKLSKLGIRSKIHKAFYEALKN